MRDAFGVDRPDLIEKGVRDKAVALGAKLALKPKAVAPKGVYQESRVFGVKPRTQPQITLPTKPPREFKPLTHDPNLKSTLAYWGRQVEAGA